MKTTLASLTLAVIAAIALSGPSAATGFATYFATMATTGKVITSSGVSKAKRTALGKYDITFTREIGGCAMLVTINGATPGYGIAQRKTGSPDVVQVATFSSGGAATDSNFHVLVSCNS